MVKTFIDPLQPDKSEEQRGKICHFIMEKK